MDLTGHRTYASSCRTDVISETKIGDINSGYVYTNFVVIQS